MDDNWKTWNRVFRALFWIWWPSICVVQAVVWPSTLDALLEVNRQVTVSDAFATIVLFGTYLLFMAWVLLWPIAALSISQYAFQGRYYYVMTSMWIIVHAVYWFVFLRI